MKKQIYLLIALMFSVLFANASHVPGGNITYECVGPNQYVITLTLYEDCGTAFTSNTDMTIQVDNDCGFPNPTVTMPNTVYQQEVSQLCQSQLPLSECNGGTMPGVYMHVWQDTITLPGPCDSWTFSYSSCCRNTSSNLVGSSDNYYWEAVLNSQTAPCNTAPAITAQPIPYVCVNQLVTYNLGVFEPDGNTITYTFIDAMTSATGIVSYQAGFSGTNPIPGITIDPATGLISFTPTAVGNYVVAVLIEEFDANGNLVGSIVQDFQFEVINCAGNDNPEPPAAGISNFSGTGVQTGPTDVQVCEGDNICFDVVFTDPNAGDSIYLSSNADLVLAGATFTQTSFFSPATATICWTAQPGSNPYSAITINAVDNSCPIVGTSVMSVGVSVINSTYAGMDEIMCLGAGVQLNATGGSNFTWSVISGDPISVGNNITCDNCPDPVANPAVTTVYEVMSNLAGGCTNLDTITVTVVPDFTYTLTQSSASTCLNSEIDITLVPTPGGAYTYDWSPGTFLNSTTVSSPTVLPTSPGTYDYAVEITSPDGCVHNDTISVNVAAAYAPDVTVTTNTTNIVCGDTVTFDTDLGGGVPATCGPSATTTCSAASSQQTIGIQTGANTSTTWPAPYGNWYRNAKHQFLFTAAELQAMGFVGGKITEIAWQVTQINGTTNYNSYTISMGCTGTTDLTTWEGGLTQVFSPQNISIATGWNTHVLTTAYEWDGISNLVVEVCYDNLATSYTNNSITPYTTTGFNSSIYYFSDGTPACPYTTTQTVSTNRPITRFTTCPTIPDPANFTFDWTPSALMADPTAQNTYSLPMVTTDYQLVVTDNNGGCTDTVNIHVDVMCDTCLAPLPTLTHITCNGGMDGEIFAQPTGIDGPPWVMELIDPATMGVLQTDPVVTTTTTFTGLTAGDYIVRSTDTTGCYADTLVTLLEPTAVGLTVSNDSIICIGGTADMTAVATGGNGAPYTYNWSGLAGTSGNETDNPLVNTTYDVYALDPMGCSSDTLPITISIFPPILTTPGANDTVCPGDFAMIDVTANGGIGGTYFYNWVDDQGNAVGSAAQISVTPTASPTTYYVTVTDNCETPPALDSVTVYWYDEPEVEFTSDIVDGCYPVDVTFTNTTDPTMVDQCFWEFGNGVTSTDCGTTNYVYNNPGIYSVTLTVTSPEGCISDTTMVNMISVYDYPDANFGANPNPADVLHPTVEFSDSSSSDVTAFEWNFGAAGVLGNDNVQNPEFTFPDDAPGTYPVELIVVNGNGCTDTTVQMIVINGVYNFYVPSAFTPNSDGVNDFFYPQGESVAAEGYKMYIFTRWGELIFESDDMNTMWDGYYKATKAEQGIYIWKIETKDDIEGEIHEYTGHVMLMR